MLTPVSTSQVPPGGWSVQIEGAGPPIKADHWSVFISEIRNRLIANGLDSHGWKERAIDLMCRQRPEIQSEDKEVPTRSVTSDDIQRFVRTIWEAWKAGAQAVSAEEQDRRAAICVECPKKGYVSCFGGCGALAATLAEMTIHSKARSIPELHKASCMVCGCELSTLTMYPLEVLQKVDAKIGFKTEEYPDHCWKKGTP